MMAVFRWTLGLTLATLLIGVPFGYYRYAYATSKRLREVTPGRFYRCGQLTEYGFALACQRYGIKSVINVQNEFPDPAIQRGFLSNQTVPESQMCAQLGVRYVFLSPELIDRSRIPAERPAVIDEFLKVMDDESVYPVLLHCKAGLHRTGLLTAIYRIEYERWSHAAAVHELRANGFGEFACTTANDYLVQYISTYRPRWAKRTEDAR